MTSAQELERLVVRLTGDGSGYLRMINDAVNATNNAMRKIQAAGNSMSILGAKMSIGITLPVTGMVKAYGSFEDAMTKSTAIMTDVTADLRKEMENTALVVSRDSTTAAAKLAEAYFFLASAGLDAKKAMMALPTVDRFAVAGAFDMATATDLLTDAQSALGMTAAGATENMLNMKKVADLLVKANILANASVQQFSESLTNEAGPAIKQYNMSVEEGIAILATYADQGLKGNHAGSMMSRMVRLLIQSINENGKAFKKLNIDTNEFAKTGKNVTGVIDGITAAVAGMGPAQKAATLEMLGFRAEAQQAILPLLGAGDKIRGYEKALADAGGTTDEVANRQLKSFTSQMLIMWNRIKEISMLIGKELVPYVVWMTDKVNLAIVWFRSLNDETKRTVALIVGLVAAIGPVLISIGGVITAFGFMLISTNAIWASLLKVLALFKGTKTAATATATGMKDLSVSTVVADTSLVSVGAAATAATPPVLALSAAVDKLSLSFKALQLAQATSVVTKTGTAASAALALPGPTSLVKGSRKGAGDDVIDTTATVINSTKAMSTAATTATTAASARSTGIIASVLRGITAMRNAAVAAGGAVNTAVVAVVGVFGKWVLIITAVGYALKSLTDWIHGPGSFNAAIKDAGTSMMNFAKTSIGFLLNIGTNWGLLVTWLKTNWFNLLKDMGTAVIVFAKNNLTNIGTMLNTLIRLVSYTAGAIAGKIGNVFAIDFPMLLVTGLEKAATLFNTFVTKIGDMWESIKNWDFSNLDNMGDSLLDWLADTGEQMINDYSKGATDESYMSGIRDIIKEQSDLMKTPFEGFESSTTDLPDFLTDIFKPVEEAAVPLGDEAKAQENAVTEAAAKTGTTSAATNEFKQMSLNQFSVAAIGGAAKPVKKQEVTDSVVASKLDDLIGVTRSKQAAVMTK